MLVRQDFKDMPPKPFLDQVMCPLAKFYCFLWEEQDQDKRLAFTWPEILKYYNKNSFRTNLRKLNNEGLLSYQENSERILIELVGWDDLSE